MPVVLAINQIQDKKTIPDKNRKGPKGELQLDKLINGKNLAVNQSLLNDKGKKDEATKDPSYGGHD